MSKIEELQEKIGQLQALKDKLEKKEKEKEEKARRHRLIELGANIESKFGADAILTLKFLTKDELAPAENWLSESENVQVARKRAEEKAREIERKKAEKAEKKRQYRQSKKESH